MWIHLWCVAQTDVSIILMLFSYFSCDARCTLVSFIFWGLPIRTVKARLGWLWTAASSIQKNRRACSFFWPFRLAKVSSQKRPRASETWVFASMTRGQASWRLRASFCTGTAGGVDICRERLTVALKGWRKQTSCKCSSSGNACVYNCAFCHLSNFGSGMQPLQIWQ